MQAGSIRVRKRERLLRLNKDILKLEEGMQDLDITAPISVRVEKAGQADTSFTEYSSGDADEQTDEDDIALDDEGQGSEAFIKLVEVDNYRIKGRIDESNISQITTGMKMVIHSRVSEQECCNQATAIRLYPVKTIIIVVHAFTICINCLAS